MGHAFIAVHSPMKSDKELAGVRNLPDAHFVRGNRRRCVLPYGLVALHRRSPDNDNEQHRTRSARRAPASVIGLSREHHNPSGSEATHRDTRRAALRTHATRVNVPGHTSMSSTDVYMYSHQFIHYSSIIERITLQNTEDRMHFG